MRFFQKSELAIPVLAGLKSGEAGEEWVSYLYQQKGYVILHRNYEVFASKKLGELDIVCQRGPDMVFVEVKTRSSEAFMPLEETITLRKQHLLRRMVKLYQRNFSSQMPPNWQIDIALVLINLFDNSIKSVTLIENAIEDV